jgi:hypothetical protein
MMKKETTPTAATHDVFPPGEPPFLLADPPLFVELFDDWFIIWRRSGEFEG